MCAQEKSMAVLGYNSSLLKHTVNTIGMSDFLPYAYSVNFYTVNKTNIYTTSGIKRSVNRRSVQSQPWYLMSLQLCQVSSVNNYYIIFREATIVIGYKDGPTPWNFHGYIHTTHSVSCSYKTLCKKNMYNIFMFQLKLALCHIELFVAEMR